MQCVVCSVQCAVCSVQCVVCSVYIALCEMLVVQYGECSLWFALFFCGMGLGAVQILCTHFRGGAGVKPKYYNLLECIEGVRVVNYYSVTCTLLFEALMKLVQLQWNSFLNKKSAIFDDICP